MSSRDGGSPSSGPRTLVSNRLGGRSRAGLGSIPGSWIKDRAPCLYFGEATVLEPEGHVLRIKDSEAASIKQQRVRVEVPLVAVRTPSGAPLRRCVDTRKHGKSARSYQLACSRERIVPSRPHFEPEPLAIVGVTCSERRSSLGEGQDGEATLLMQHGGRAPLRAGDVVRTPPGDVHGVENTGRGPFVYLAITSPPPGFYSLLPTPSRSPLRVVSGHRLARQHSTLRSAEMDVERTSKISGAITGKVALCRQHRK